MKKATRRKQSGGNPADDWGANAGDQAIRGQNPQLAFPSKGGKKRHRHSRRHTSSRRRPKSLWCTIKNMASKVGKSLGL